MSDEFQDILSGKPSDIHEPTPVPPGTWLLQILSGKVAEVKRDSGPKAEVTFPVKAIQPMEDVSEALLEEFPPEMYEQGRARVQFPLWEQSSWWPVKRFLTNAGVDVDAFESKEDMVKAAKGCYVLGFIEWDEAKDGTKYANVTSSAKAED